MQSLIIFIMAIMAFAIGTAEFLPMGILLEISSDLGITIPQAGQLITIYAFGVAIGAPIMTIILMKYNKKYALIVCMSLYIIGNIISSISTNYPMLMVARIIASLAHGAGFGLGVILISELVEESKRNTSIAIMFSGLTIAHIIGVPIGTFIGQQWGWRASFIFVAIFGILAVIGLMLFVPRSKENSSIDTKQEFVTLLKKPVIIALLTTVFGFAGVFMVFTYIAPILTQISKVEEKYISMILLLFGVGSTIGNLLGGRLADRNLARASIGTLSALTICQIFFSFSMNYKLISIITIVILGIASLAVCSPFQATILKNAKEAPNLSSSMNVAAFNVANGLGAMLGGQAIQAGISFNMIPLIAGGITAVGLLLAIYNIKLDKLKLR